MGILTPIKAGRRPAGYADARFSSLPSTTWEQVMSLQKIFEKSENAAVGVVFALFLVSHFGVLYLFTLV